MAAPFTLTEPSPSPSLSLEGSLLRASQSRQGNAAHLGHTQMLNKYMPRLQGKCLFHFVLGKELVPDHYPSCQYMREQSSAQGDYKAFRRLFNFSTEFEYCYSCGALQNQEKNRECLVFHVSLMFGKYDYNHILFRTVFCIWQNPNLRNEMVCDLGITVSLTSQQDFAQWANEVKAMEGKYHNCSEAFLWFCEQLERHCPSFFM